MKKFTATAAGEEKQAVRETTLQSHFKVDGSEEVGTSRIDTAAADATHPCCKCRTRVTRTTHSRSNSDWLKSPYVSQGVGARTFWPHGEPQSAALLVRVSSKTATRLSATGAMASVRGRWQREPIAVGELFNA